jgi:hypothetical protein
MAIKVYRSTDAGAPSLNGNAASLITVLDAVLVNGYNSISITGITRSGTTATVTCGAAHGLSTDDWALVAGAAQSDYNIEAQVTVTDSTHFTYQVANSPTTPATGTITVKRAPGGFTKAFSATGKAAYRANRLDSARHFLRVLDDASSAGAYKEAQTWSYENMTDVDTGTGPTATVRYWNKSTTGDGTARNWIIITDGKLIYYVCGTDGAAATLGGAANYYHAGVWGDFISNKAGDTYNVVHIGALNANSQTNGNTNALAQQVQNMTNTGGVLIARSYTAVSSQVTDAALMATIMSTVLGAVAYITYPHAVDNGLYLTPVNINEGAKGVLRGRLPGAYETMHGRCLPNWTVFDNVQGLSGRRFIMLYTTTSGNACSVVLDITGSSNEWD